MEQLTLFTETAEEELARTREEILDEIARRYPVAMPDDLSVIRMLVKEEMFYEYDDLEYIVTKYVDNQTERRFDMYDYSMNEYDAYVQSLQDKVMSIVSGVHDVLIEAFEICASEIKSVFIDNRDTQADYIAYLYNINAQFHGKEQLPYRELIKALTTNL